MPCGDSMPTLHVLRTYCARTQLRTAYLLLTFIDFAQDASIRKQVARITPERPIAGQKSEFALTPGRKVYQKVRK